MDDWVLLKIGAKICKEDMEKIINRERMGPYGGN